MFGALLVYMILGIVGVLGIWLIVYLIRKFFKVILAIILGFVVFMGAGFFFSLSKVSGNKSNWEKDETRQTDSSANQSNEENLDRNKVYVKKTISWSDYYDKKHSFNYKIGQSEYEQAKNNRASFTGETWGEIYGNLYQNDRNMLSSVYQKFDSLKTGYDALDFARLIVSSIQHVPYTWILTESCEDAPNAAQIKTSGYKCLGNIQKYAILSPAEFLVTRKGDCDTKAMVLYTILKHFNYDVCIFISEEYAHAMLGINISTTGKYLSYGGTRYYFWETTVDGMDVGIMPPDYSNLSLWSVAL